MIVHVDRSSRIPIYEQIADQLRMLILSGGLISGHRLPSTRELADTLSVNRKTVVQAYRMIKAEGLVRGNGRGGTVVQSEEPAHAVSPRSRPVLWKRMITESSKPAYISSDGFYREWRRHFHSKDRADCYEMGLHRIGDRQLLQDAWRGVMQDIDEYGLSVSPVHGYEPLRKLLFKRAIVAGIDVSTDSFMLVDSINQACFLLAVALFNRGDSVALEVPCPPSLIHVYNVLGVRIEPVPIDHEGANLDVLEGLLKRSKPKLIQVFPTYRIPNGTSMGLHRRKDLLTLARRYRVPILEIPEFETFRYEGDSIPSVHALDGDCQTIYVSGLEADLPLGMRVSWIAAPAHVIRAITPIKQAIEPSIHPLNQAVIHRVLTHPNYSPETMRLQGMAWRDNMAAMLEAHCSDVLRFHKPQGGMHIWAELLDRVDLSSSMAQLAEYSTICLPGYFYYPEMRGGERNLAFSYDGCAPEYVARVIQSVGDLLR